MCVEFGGVRKYFERGVEMESRKSLKAHKSGSSRTSSNINKFVYV